MANKNSLQQKRLEIPFFDGVNTLVASNIYQKGELTHAENARSVTIGTVEKRKGTRRLGSEITATNNFGIFYFKNTVTNGFYRVSTVSATTNIYYTNGSGVWTVLAGAGAGLSAANVSVTFAEGNCFIVNGTDVNRYITSDGTTAVAASTVSYTNHMYNSPKGFKINFYKNRLYVGDFYISTTRKKNGIQQSSEPLGIASLVSGDHASGVTTIEVTDTKYIYATDSLDVYRGNVKIETLAVTAKTTTSITVTATSNALESADELWVVNTFGGSNRVFRWINNAPGGEPVKEYDTFYLSGDQNDSINLLTNIGNVMMIANNNNMAVWNGYSLEHNDLGIGCVSENGYTKTYGALWFVHYTGIYSTTGGAPQMVSAKVQKYIDGATKDGLEASCVGSKGMSVFFAIGDVTLYHDDGSTNKTLSDVCLEYNVRQENWYVHTGIDAKFFATYFSSTDPDRLEYASKSDSYHIYELLNTEEQDGEEIPFRIDTDHITLAPNFENISYLHKVIVESERGSGIQCFIQLDDGPFYKLEGEAKKGCTIFKANSENNEIAQPPRCRRVKISIRDYTTKICKISRVALIYVESPEEEIEQNI